MSGGRLRVLYLGTFLMVYAIRRFGYLFWFRRFCRAPTCGANVPSSILAPVEDNGTILEDGSFIFYTSPTTTCATLRSFTLTPVY